MTDTTRRGLLRTGAALAALSPVLTARAAGDDAGAVSTNQREFSNLVSMTTDAKPITPAERRQRREKLAGLLSKQGVFAVLIEPGATLDYFTGVKWWLSERLTAALLTAEGQMVYITPAFEESRLREMAGDSAEVLTWEEDEDPFVMLAAWVKAKRPMSGKKAGKKAGILALDEALRYFVAYRLGQALPEWTLQSAANEVNNCRMIKSATELALMKLANDVTVAAYRAVYPLVQEGMSGPDIGAMMKAAMTRLGGETASGGAQVGKGSALPHGSKEPEYVRDGMIVLMDFGCAVQGYRSDISRTFVHGQADDDQRRLWQLVRKGQEKAFAAARPGTPAGDVDKVVRRFYESEGFGPGYQLPGLSHRLGHGIGLEVHEPINFVGNETTPLQPGMCFSNEPGLYVPGKYGVRLEDCIYITDSGPRWFSEPPPSIDKPMG